jgi:hypothetical protein
VIVAVHLNGNANVSVSDAGVPDRTAAQCAGPAMDAAAHLDAMRGDADELIDP